MHRIEGSPLSKLLHDEEGSPVTLVTKVPLKSNKKQYIIEHFFKKLTARPQIKLTTNSSCIAYLWFIINDVAKDLAFSYLASSNKGTKEGELTGGI